MTPTQKRRERRRRALAALRAAVQSPPVVSLHVESLLDEKASTTQLLLRPGESVSVQLTGLHFADGSPHILRVPVAITPGEPMRRDDLIRLKVAGEAIARAAADALGDEARHEWDHNGSAASWRTAAGTAYANITHNRVEVTDEDAFLRWLAEHHPTEVVQKLAVRNPAWLKTWLEGLTKAIETGETDAPPGTKPVAGGDFKNITIRPDAGMARLVASAAKDAIQRGQGLELEAILARADALADFELHHAGRETDAAAGL